MEVIWIDLFELEFNLEKEYFLIIGVKPGCTISIKDDDLLSIMSGKLNMMTVLIKLFDLF